MCNLNVNAHGDGGALSSYACRDDLVPKNQIRVSKTLIVYNYNLKIQRSHGDP